MQSNKLVLMLLAALTASNQASAKDNITLILDAAQETYIKPAASGISMQSYAASATSTDPASSENRNQLMAELALERLEQSFEISPETTELIGDAIDLNSGGLSLTHTDIAIPGNFPLDVALTRTFKGRQYSARNALSFADWQLDIPAISTSMLQMPDGSYTGSWGKGIACSGDVNPGVAKTWDDQFWVNPSQYWSGDFINIPGQSGERILQVPGSTQKFAKNWKLQCISSEGVEGYKATRADGVSFTFDKLALINTKPAEISWREMNVNIETPRYNALLHVSKVEDRFGNWVKYHYNAPGELAYIDSSDGRRIDISYEQGTYRKRIATVTANNQTWRYHYRVTYDARNVAHDQLSKVVLPDGRQWQLDLQLDTFSELEAKRMILGFEDKIIGEKQCLEPSSLNNTATITHPNGAQATFTLAPTRFGRSKVPVQFVFQNKYNNYDRCFVNFAVVEKRLTGPGMKDMQWTYRYSENAGMYNGTQPYDAGPAGQPLSGLPTPVAGYSLNDLKSTTVIAPDGSKAIHVFDRSFTVTENQKAAEFYFDTDGVTLLQSQRYTYTPMAVNAEVRLNYCADATSTGGVCRGPVYENEAPHKHFVNKSFAATTTYVNGVQANTYTTLYNDYNSYGQHTRQVEFGGVSGISKHQRFSFQHDLNHWLLNLPTKTELSENALYWTTVSETSYYPSSHIYKSLPKEQFQFGVLRSTNSSYHADGNLKLINMNSPNLWAQYENYKRGKPQLIKLPQRYNTSCTNPNTCFISASQVVNNNGTVAQVTDFKGYSTHYLYDAMGRLTTITPADIQWSPTSIDYAISGGYFTQSISRGNYRKTLTLDGLLRPILSHEWDNSNAAATSRYTVQRFNAYNKPLFSSYPSTSSTESQGTVYEYDGLQRPTRQYNTVDNTALEYAYLANNQVRTTDARGNSTTTSYRAFGSPSQTLPSKIEQPHGVTTDINYNIFDNVTTITQGGITESRIYNAQQRLCRLVRPDVGHTAYSYNTLGQPVWVAQGASGGATACNEASVTAAQKVSYSYDNLGAPRSINYPDSTPDKTYTFDNQGNLTSLVAGTAVWDYSYNSAHLMDSEILTLNNISWLITPSYNALGQVSSVTYPSGKSISYAPNALGQPTQVGNYVTNASYYPSGQVKGYRYGNGLMYSQTLDNQQRPEYQTVKRSNSNVLNHRYQYDANHNIDSISDLLSPAKNISLTYDDLDRLDTATGFWGSGSFSYDALGNITSKTLGSEQLSYSYNTSNRLTGISGSISRSFGYDSRGNVTQNGQRSFSFNLANQLTTSGTNSYQYDGYNRRVKKTSNGKTQYSLYNAAGQLLMTDGDNGPTEYFYLGSKLIAKENQVATTEDTPGYTGHLEDDDLQLTYMQARYYDPVIGRFYSNDPVGFTNVHTFNRYAYANNNPYKYVDPDGREVRAIYNNATGQLSMRDRDTGERIVINAESGGKPFGAPIEPGVYDILFTPRDGFYRLEALDGVYGDDTHNATGRDLFRLHKPGRTIGCIAAENDEGWSKVEGMLEKTSTSEVTVENKSRNPFSEKTESSTRFGQLKVVEVSGRIESQKLKEQN